MLYLRLLGLLLALMVMAGCGAVGGSNQGSRAAEAAPARPVPGSAPVGFRAVDLTWISADQGWALGVAPGCSGQRCATILETTDGGREWVTVSDLHACLIEASPVGCPAGVNQVSSVRFASPDVGYAFSQDGGPLLQTTNGGLTWAVQPGRQVSSVKLADGTAVRVSFSKSGCPGPCDWSVDVAAIGQQSWRPLLTPPASVNHVRVVLLHQGSKYLYVAFLGNPAAGRQQAQLFVSTDLGTNWTQRPDPCARAPVRDVAVRFSAAPGGVLAALCAPRSGTGADSVTLSTDAGGSFGPLRPLPGAGYTELALPSAGELFAAVGGSRLAGSVDGGKHWRVLVRQRVAGGAPVPQFLGFESPTVGRWLGGSKLWTTTDSGSTWTSLGF